MPSGSYHSAATILLAATSGLAAYYSRVPTAHTLALTGGCLVGLIINPDLDVDGVTVSHVAVQRSAGCLVAGLWRLFWLPYSRLFPHRHSLSHFPVISTIIRLLYIAMPLWLCRLIGAVDLPEWWSWAFAGLVAADGLHYILDKLKKN